MDEFPPPDAARDRRAAERARVIALQEEVAGLKTLVETLLRENALESILQNGFAELAQCLEPLRDLSAQRQPIAPESSIALGILREALDRPDWSRSDLEPVAIVSAEPLGDLGTDQTAVRSPRMSSRSTAS